MIQYSIIIPHLNNKPRLMKCLDAIYSQINKKTEVLIIDNGSDNTNASDFEKYNGLELYIVTEIKSPYWCRNYGIRKAKGKYIILCDSNCIPFENWFTKGINLIVNDKNLIASGPIIFDLNQSSSIYEIADSFTFTHQEDSFLDGNSYPGTHLFFERSIIDKIGDFPNIRSGADIYWTNLATSSGYSLGYDEDVKVSYLPKRKNLLYKKSYRIGKGYIERKLINNNKVPISMIPYAIKIAIPPHPINYYKRYRNLKNVKDDIFSIIGVYLILIKCKLIRSYAIIKETLISYE